MKTYLTTLVSTLLLTFFAHAEPAGQTIKIGHVTDLTGIGAFFGTAVSQGVQLGEKFILSQGGTVDVLTEDIAGKTPLAALAAQKLINQNSVDALICDLTAPCFAVHAIAKKSGIPLLYHSPSIQVRKDNSLAFRNFIDYRVTCGALAAHVSSSGSESASLNPMLEFGDLCLEGVNDKIQDHQAFRYNPQDDLRSTVTSIASKKFKRLFFTGYEVDFLQLIRLVNQFESNIQLNFIDLLLTKDSLVALKDIRTPPLVAGFPNPSENFVKSLTSELGTLETFNPNLSALGFNAIRSIYEAIQICSPRDNECIIKKLSNPPANSELNFKGFDDSNSPYPVVIRELR